MQLGGQVGVWHYTNNNATTLWPKCGNMIYYYENTSMCDAALGYTDRYSILS